MNGYRALRYLGFIVSRMPLRLFVRSLGRGLANKVDPFLADLRAVTLILGILLST